MSGNPYDEKFYNEHIQASLKSAELMLAALFQSYEPSSVADFGCGRGAWLSAAKTLGATELIGFDGPWVSVGMMIDKSIAFTPIDFSEDLKLDRRVDLAISVEVAEHLPESRASWFVETICEMSDVVVFGAAIPGQGGADHVNEQWPSYWGGKFEESGYVMFDFFRPKLWAEDRCEWWYRQNTFLYVKQEVASQVQWLSRTPRVGALADAVHPRMFRYRDGQREKLWRKVNRPTLWDCGELLINFAKGAVKSSIGRR
jgi:SAM-dependent methyltransferase